jgi:site-specific DNA-methyltransferase (adenine-specific)
MSLYYQDDYVTLYHGDCLTEHREWLDADVLVTDPPYGMAYVSSASKHKGKTAVIAGDGDTMARDGVLDAWGSRPGLAFGTWRTNKPASTRLTLTWDKGVSPGMGDLALPWGISTEEIYVIGSWPAIKPGGRVREGGKPSRAASVLRVDTLNSQAIDRPDHPTPKPVPLMERLIEKCPPGTIADPFAGSGATLVAAKNLGRKVIGVELEERYCEIIAKRCAQEVLDIFGGAA